MDIAIQLKQIVRRLGRAPMFTAIVLLTLAAAIGANTAVFSVIEGVLLKPLPYSRSSRLVGVWIAAPSLNIPELTLSAADYLVYREQNRTFQNIGIYQNGSVSVTGVGEPEQVQVLGVSDGVLPVLGVSPLLGRTFTRQDDSSDAPKTVLLSYGYWQSKFAGKRSAIGQTIRVNGDLRTIIGVMPASFHFLSQEDASLILPIQLDPSKVFLGNFNFRGIALLKPGVTIAQANADVARMLPIVLRSFPAPPGYDLQLFQHAKFGPDVHPLKQDVVGSIGTPLWVLMGSIGMVLLIACANVANLLLVRAEGRGQELVIRTALGATRGQIALELLLESLTLGLMGGILGLGVAYGALRLLLVTAPAGLPRVGNISIDGTVLVFTLAISVFVSLLFGAVPALKYAGSSAGTALREGGRTLSQSKNRHRARNVLVATQVALAFVLLVGSGLMFRTFRALTELNPGFTHPGQVQTFRVAILGSQVSNPEDVVRMQQNILRKVAAIPGISSAGITTSVPMTGHNSSNPVFAQDHIYAPGQIPPICHFVLISPGYLRTVGTSLVTGRDFTWSDNYDKLPVTMVSESMARRYWGSARQALGKRIRSSSKDDWRRVVGVVADVRSDGMDQPSPLTVYTPLLRAHFDDQDISVRRSVAFAVRTPRGGSPALLSELHQAVWSVDAKLPLYQVHTLDYFYRRSTERTSFTLILLSIAGAMALLLGGVGLYGVIAYSVSHRQREIGIRMAMGAQAEQLTAMFLRQGILLAGVGVAVGLFAAILLTRAMSSLLFGVNPIDPLTYGAVAIGLTSIAIVASYLPSRRARLVDPVVALRAE